jgi:8-oxo-dGTP pyrophosphatase MutT (NUDIX family)
MRSVQSCGVIVFRRQPELSFLLMKHRDRLDLPKGHREEGETEVECALRELGEETGLTAADVHLDEGFRHTVTYHPIYKRLGERVEKTVVLFLGWLVTDAEVRVSEHEGHEWRAWAPPHSLGQPTVDSVLAACARHFAASSREEHP